MKTKFYSFTLILFLIAILNGCNQRRVIEKKMSDDTVIQAVFSKNEIKELSKIRLMVDKMVISQTGEAESKTAYDKFITSLGKIEMANEISTKIPFSNDSLVQIIKASSTFQEIWIIYDKQPLNSISLNLNGKVSKFMKLLAKENTNYNPILQEIEGAGDLSPSVIGDFLKIPMRYNWENEAEKLYACIVLVVLTNPTYTKADMYLQQAVKLLQNPDSALFWVNKAIALDSANHASLCAKAQILIGKNKHLEALNLYTKCSTICPEIAETWGIMGILNDYLGKTKEATQCYNQTIALYNRLIESGDKRKIYIAKLNKAMILRMNNQENESTLLFKELLNEYPADSTIAYVKQMSKQAYLNSLQPHQKQEF